MSADDCWDTATNRSEIVSRCCGESVPSLIQWTRLSERDADTALIMLLALGGRAPVLYGLDLPITAVRGPSIHWQGIVRGN